MRGHWIRLGVVISAQAVLVCACVSSTQPPVSGSTQESPGATPGAQAGGGLCENQYQPVVEGAAYSRRSTSSLGGSSYTATITNVTPSGFNLERSGTLASGRTYTSTEVWKCTEEGLAQFLTEDLAAVYTGANGSVTVTMISNEGVTLPKSIQPGDDWSQQMNADVTGPDSTDNWTVTYSFTAAGSEEVSTPAGAFDATKVYLHVDSATGGQTVMEADLTLWVAPGVGVVKSDFGMGGEVLSTTELVSYTIP
jgi:hypothetical protein